MYNLCLFFAISLLFSHSLITEGMLMHIFLQSRRCSLELSMFGLDGTSHWYVFELDVSTDVVFSGYLTGMIRSFQTAIGTESTHILEEATVSLDSRLNLLFFDIAFITFLI